MSLNGKGINETNELDCLRALVLGQDQSVSSGQDVNLVKVGGATVALGTGTPAQSLPVTEGKWVRHSQDVGASGTAVFPNGCIYSYVVVTGTAGDGTMTGLPAGFSDSSQGFPIVTGFTLTTASASSAKAVWFTAT